MYFLIDGLLFLWYQQWDYLCIVMYFLIDGLFFMVPTMRLFMHSDSYVPTMRLMFFLLMAVKFCC
jgi:hypothetical protein